MFLAKSFRTVAAATILFATAPSYFLLWFPTLILQLFPSQTALYFFLDEKLFSLYQRFVVFFYETLMLTNVVLSGDVDKLKAGKENVFYISNHQSTVDWIIVDMVLARQGGIGRVRYILKEGLKYLPLYGYHFEKHGCIYVDRGAFCKAKAIKKLQELKNNRNKIWLVIFPEGTRVLPNSKRNEMLMEKSRHFAEEQGLLPLRYHLTPRVLGAHLSLKELGNYLDAFYDVTVAYSDTFVDSRRVNAPGMFDFFHKFRRTIHIHIARIPISDVPVEEISLRNWLHSRFLLKDKHLERFQSFEDSHRVDALSPDGKSSPLPLSQTLPAAIFWIFVNMILMGTTLGRTLYFGTLFFGTALGALYFYKSK